MSIDIDQILERIITPIVKKAIHEAIKDSAPKEPKYGRFLSVDQLAKESGYSKHSIYQMSCNRQIPGATKIGSKLLFETQSALDWIKEGCPKLKRS